MLGSECIEGIGDCLRVALLYWIVGRREPRIGTGMIVEQTVYLAKTETAFEGLIP